MEKKNKKNFGIWFLTKQTSGFLIEDINTVFYYCESAESNFQNFVLKNKKVNTKNEYRRFITLVNLGFAERPTGKYDSIILTDKGNDIFHHNENIGLALENSIFEIKYSSAKVEQIYGIMFIYKLFLEKNDLKINSKMFKTKIIHAHNFDMTFKEVYSINKVEINDDRIWKMILEYSEYFVFDVNSKGELYVEKSRIPLLKEKMKFFIEKTSKNKQNYKTRNYFGNNKSINLFINEEQMKYNVEPKNKQRPRKNTENFSKFDTNPQIKKDVIKKENYTCEICKCTTFEKDDGDLYAEGHHFIPMCNSGEFYFSLDFTYNIICLCPTCHREIHYGKNRFETLKVLEYKLIKINEYLETNINYEKLCEFYKKT